LQETDSLDAQIAQAELEASQLARSPQHQQNGSLNSATDIPIDLEQIQQHLADHTLLYYHIIREAIWVFVINKNGLKEHLYVAHVSEIQDSQMALTQSIDRALEMSVHFGLARANRNAPALIADANTHLSALYQRLIQPVADKLIDEQSLYISTDGLLHAIPFHALYDSGHYLIERHAISYVPSLTVFTLCMQPQVEQATSHRNAHAQSVLLFGYDNKNVEEEMPLEIEGHADAFCVAIPDLFNASATPVASPLTLRRNEHQFLPAVESELNWLQQLFPAAQCYRGKQATTKQFLNAAPHCRLLHFAAHAHFRVDKPMLSAFTLADRRLTLAEINALRLNTELVVLSGCETTYGSLLVSMWSVEDSVTAKLMAEFYHTLRAGESRSASLRQAQCAILTAARKSPEFALYAHPAYWAPFTLIGNAEPLQFETNFEI